MFKVSATIEYLLELVRGRLIYSVMMVFLNGFTRFSLVYATGKEKIYGGYDFDPFYPVLMFFQGCLGIYIILMSHPKTNKVTRLDYCQYLFSSQINYTLTNFAEQVETLCAGQKKKGMGKEV